MKNGITCLQVTDNSEANHLGNLWINELTSKAQGEGVLTINTQKRTPPPCTELEIFRTFPHSTTPKTVITHNRQ